MNAMNGRATCSSKPPERAAILSFCKLAALVAAALIFAGAWAVAGSIPFAAKELGLRDAVPCDADFDRPFEKPLPARVMDTKDGHLVQLSNCRDYLEVWNRICGSDNDADYRVLRLQTVPCIALALLRSAGTAQQTSLPKDFIRYITTTAYPATLWPAVSEEGLRSAALPGATLFSACGKKAWHKANDETLELEADGFGVHLTLLAREDFDNDGWEDAAFRWEAYALHGSYTDARLVVLTRSCADCKMRELPIEKLLPLSNSDDR